MSEIITDLGFDSKSLWQPKGFVPSPYPETTWPHFEGLDLKKLNEIEGEDLTPLQNGVNKPMVEGGLSSFL